MNSSYFPPKTRPIIGCHAGSANNRPGFWHEIAEINEKMTLTLVNSIEME